MAASRFAITGAALACALGLGACVGFEGEPAGEQAGSDAVRAKFKVCAGLSSPDCSDQGPTDDGDYRLLVGIRVPKGSDVPARLLARGPDVELSRLRPYRRELNRLAPKRETSTWFGWVSPVFTYDESAGPDSARFRVRLGLPRDAGRRFRFRPVVSYMELKDPAAIDCGDDAFDPNEGNTLCIDAPDTREETRSSVVVRLD